MIIHIWAKKTGSRPRAVSQTKYEWLYAVGAVCPESGESAGQKPIPIGINPVENLWHYLRSHYWANRIYADYDALRLAAVDAWQKAALDKETVKSVCFITQTDRFLSS